MGHLKLKWIVLFCYFLLFSGFVKGDFNFHFRYLTINEGLPQNTVHAILKDQKGFMWFATGNGLSRFDGYDFVNFWKPDILSNLVHALAETSDGKVWIGTSHGLSYFDQQTQTIQAFEIDKRIDNLNIISLFVDGKQRLWVGTAENGFYCIEQGKDKRYSLKHWNTTNSILAGNHIPSFIQLSDNRILIGSNTGLYVMDDDSNSPREFEFTSPGTSLILSLFETNEGDLWIGTFNGVWVYNPITGRNEWFSHDPFNPEGLSHGRVNHIAQDRNGTIYIATLGGVDIYQPESNSFRSLPYKTLNDFSLNSIFINLIYTDDQGNIWIGTEKGGVNQFSLYQKPFSFLIKEETNSNSLSESTVNSILSDGNIIYIGTAGGGLNKFNKGANSYEHFRFDPYNDFSLPNDYVTSLLKTPDGDLWIGTWGGGICKLLTDGRFQRFIPVVPNPETGYENAFVSSLLYDERGYLFVGTEGGLGILELKSEEFLIIDENHNALAHIREIGDLMLDVDGFIWAATRAGLYRFSSDRIDFAYDAVFPERNLTIYRRNGTILGSESLPGNYITTVYEDKDFNIWIGTHGDGLVMFKRNSISDFQQKVYTVEDGLSNNVIYSIEQDQDGYIWVSTDYGLSRLNPSSGNINNYTTDDGLLSNQFYWTASDVSESGELFFGSINGVSFFYPGEFETYLYEPKPTITSLRVFNELLKVGDRRNGRVVFKTPLTHTDEISLSYKDNIFSIGFSALDYFHPKKVKYAYQLENVDRDWVEVTSDQRIANYSNLKGGQYLFRVRTTNSEGEWSNKERHLLITIRPPFWQTTWFLILLVGLVSLGVAFYMRHHTKRLLLEKSRLEKMVRERTARIEDQNNLMRQQAEELKKTNLSLQKRKELIEEQKKELEKKNSEIVNQRDTLISLNKEIEAINQSRLRFFTNISHEFRTPLTLIISPLERMLKEMELPSLARELLHSVQRNARRLNLLIDQLLMFRKIETGNLRVRIVEEDITILIAEIYHAFENLAKQREIEFVLKIDLEATRCWFDSAKIENILYNLLSNAFKYTHSKGRIELVVSEIADSERESGSSLMIEVNDNGVGISEHQVEKIFDRFYRATDDASIKGSGIGLSLTKELVEVLKGTIKVVNNHNQGTRFIVTLPLRKEDFPEAEINEIPVFDMVDLNDKVQVVSDNLTNNDSLISDFPEEENREETILVVEDNKELAAFIANALSMHYRLFVAENGKIGYDLARKHTPDLVISDVMMPEMNGVDLCRQIKNNLYTSHIPVILLSAKTLLEDQLIGIQSGADDYVSKPFSLEILRAKVRNVIESRRVLRAKFAANDDLTPAFTETESLDDKFLARAHEVLEESYSNPEFSVEIFSDQMFVSRSLLYKKLKALVNFSPNDFITVYRLKKALPMLSSKNMSINEVAYTVGFNDPKYFSRVFKKFYKKSPSDYFS